MARVRCGANSTQDSILAPGLRFGASRAPIRAPPLPATPPEPARSRRQCPVPGSELSQSRSETTPAMDRSPPILGQACGPSPPKAQFEAPALTRRRCPVWNHPSPRLETLPRPQHRTHSSPVGPARPHRLETPSVPVRYHPSHGSEPFHSLPGAPQAPVCDPSAPLEPPPGPSDPSRTSLSAAPAPLRACALRALLLAELRGTARSYWLSPEELRVPIG